MSFKWIKSLTTWIFIAFIGGILAGHFIGEDVLFIANPMADIFINSLKMVVMPLIIFSIVSGILNLGSGKNLEKLGLKTISYYIMTTAVAIITGQILVSIVKPGVGAENLLQSDVSHIPAAEGSIVDMLVKVIPTNPFTALAEGNVIQVIFFLILFSMFT
ncbi:MAG: dicarboxylate/amino acid:cation symporter, partial [Calditrichia bacterium]|nr:dicarboxylate/amino acid:cation symporter [Calditrichia bacterium]